MSRVDIANDFSDELLNRMEDPIAIHVMPPPNKRPSKAIPGNNKPKEDDSTALRRNQHGVMKTALEEDEYVGVLERIIERDYFPDIAMVHNTGNDDDLEQNVSDNKLIKLAESHASLDSFCCSLHE